MRPLDLLLVAIVVGGCAASGPASGAAEGRLSPEVPSADAAGPSASPQPSQTPGAGPGSAPAELAGTWRRVVQGDTVLLTLDETGYNISRAGNFGAGRIEVTGDRIRFYDSTLCDGQGIYAWGFEDGRLRLTEVEDDPCSGRTDVLLRGTFGRDG
jgi:hypothetical protein